MGSPTIYAGTQQFGAEKGAFDSYGHTGFGGHELTLPIPWGDIPPRPFLGLSNDDRDEIAALVSDYVLGAFR